MSNDKTGMMLQLRSLVREQWRTGPSLASVAVPEPAPDEVLVRIPASLINPNKDQGHD